MFEASFTYILSKSLMNTRTKKLQNFYLKGFGAFYLGKILSRYFTKIYLCLTHKNSYQFGNCFYVFNLSAILFTIFCLDLHSRWEYISAVVEMLLWPKYSCTSFNENPISTSKLAAEWRKSWNLIFGSLLSSIILSKCRDIYPGLKGLPSSHLNI